MASVFRVRCYTCDGFMLEDVKLHSSNLHYFSCPNNCPNSRRIICESTITQAEIDEQYRLQKKLKANCR